MNYSTMDLAAGTGWTEKLLRNALERRQYAPREGKSGNRYEFSAVDAVDAAIILRLTRIGYELDAAVVDARECVNAAFQIRPSRPAPEVDSICKQAAGQFLLVETAGDGSKRAWLQKHLPFSLPAKSQLNFRFPDSVVSTIDLGALVRNLFDNLPSNEVEGRARK